MPKDLSRPRPSSIERFYAPIHDQMVRNESSAEARPTVLEFIETLSRFDIAPSGRALDAGCGGTAAVAIACASHGFRRVHGVDINEASLDHAKALADAFGDKIHLSCASVLSLPFQDNTFDFASCIGVAHHTNSPEGVIAELARVLRPNARLYFSVYCFAGSCFEWIVSGLRFVGGRIPFKLMHSVSGKSRVMNNFVLDHMYVPTLWLFRAEEVRTLLVEHGFLVHAEWASKMDPFAGRGWMGQQISGDGLMRVWLCERR